MEEKEEIKIIALVDDKRTKEMLLETAELYRRGLELLFVYNGQEALVIKKAPDKDV